MVEKITASFDTLLRQGPMTTHDILYKIVNTVDECFGEGYSDKNPQLVGQLVQASIFDLGAAVLAQQLREGLDGLTAAIEQLDFQSSGEQVKEGLTEIANAMVGPFDDTLSCCISGSAKDLGDKLELLRYQHGS